MRTGIRALLAVAALMVALLPCVTMAAPAEQPPVSPALPALQELPPLPEAVASFGAALAGDQLYVYGGHVGETHHHSIENLSHAFRRLDLADPAVGWQDLGAVPGLQGLPLVAYRGRVCRVGGLSAHNHQDAEEEDLHSMAEVACFDPAKGLWETLPPLPAGRSSHDAVVVGDRLYVVGGWQLRGAALEPRWHDSIAVLDLGAARPVWRNLPQPFQRRALAVAAAGGKIYAFGGLGTEGTSRQVDVFDPATETWSTGPELPEMAGPMRGFGVSAFGVVERIFLSGGDGVIHVLDATTDTWQPARERLAEPRFFHRLLPHGDRLLFVGGAARGGHLASVEVLPLPDASRVAARAALEAVGEADGARIWPGFRGRGDGHADDATLPLHWDEDHGVAWRVALPGYGQSSPVVWGQQVFVTSTDGARKEILILSALDLETGEVRWRRRFAASQEIESSDMVSRAAPTPVVDGERIYAFWESGDVLALSHEGETLWHRCLTDDYGPFLGNHGVASSPVLAGEAVVLQVTHDGPSYFVALDRGTGENRWKVDRPPGVAWTTPTVVEGEEGLQIVTSGAGRVEGLDAATGAVLWSRDGVERVFFFGQKGETTVLRISTGGPEVMAENSLPTGDYVYGAAAVEGALVIRTGEEVVRIGPVDSGDQIHAVDRGQRAEVPPAAQPGPPME